MRVITLRLDLKGCYLSAVGLMMVVYCRSLGWMFSCFVLVDEVLLPETVSYCYCCVFYSYGRVGYCAKPGNCCDVVSCSRSDLVTVAIPIYSACLVTLCDSFWGFALGITGLRSRRRSRS